MGISGNLWQKENHSGKQQKEYHSGKRQKDYHSGKWQKEYYSGMQQKLAKISPCSFVRVLRPSGFLASVSHGSDRPCCKGFSSLNKAQVNPEMELCRLAAIRESNVT